ncbi:hypothetical protein RF11_05717 [Thelohanellus kitauei]|uniref:Uncharacterized protein n=1 Tax=Thelohanellus kitauei TaxID=669202 RepID=A0A0C2JU62_THEKT|nr:hypothetical protein RF11_08461 [Thelohanellus kitauei]KII72923.1 hypothetical protein RF11_05717 [Thelohanellus kitauei]
MDELCFQKNMFDNQIMFIYRVYFQGFQRCLIDLSMRSKIEGDHSFEILVLEEWTRYHMPIHNRGRISIIINIHLIALAVVLGIRHLWLYIMKRRYINRLAEQVVNQQNVSERTESERSD